MNAELDFVKNLEVEKNVEKTFSRFSDLLEHLELCCKISNSTWSRRADGLNAMCGYNTATTQHGYNTVTT